MNVIALWMALLNTPERAKKIRARVDGFAPPPLDDVFGPEPPQCPTTVLFGAEVSRLLYLDPIYRPALDAWDTGEVSRADIRRWCLMIEKGQHTGVTFYPDDAWRANGRALTTWTAAKAALLWQTLHPPTLESPRSSGREPPLASLDTAFRKLRAR